MFYINPLLTLMLTFEVPSFVLTGD